MITEIKVKHVNGLKDARVKFAEMGDITHLLTFDVVLDPGDLERTLMLFKQRIPINLTISSPQSKIDLKINLISDTTPDNRPVDRTTLGEVKEGVTAEVGAKGGRGKG
jgi:hypothetical protein